MTTQEADLLIKIVGIGGTISAILFAVYQYNKGQKWQKANILLTLIDHFEEDDKIRLAREMLDWDKRNIFVTEGRTINFSNEQLLKALEVPDMDDDRFTVEQAIIRDAFDSFFDFFHKLYSFQKSGLLTFNDFTYFYYYFELLRDIENYKRQKELKPIIDKYIDSYHFIGIRFLLKQYENNPEPLDIMELNDNKK